MTRRKLRCIAIDEETVEQLVGDVSYLLSGLNELLPAADGSEKKGLVRMGHKDIRNRLPDTECLRTCDAMPSCIVYP
jgi:hypothetical protein